MPTTTTTAAVLRDPEAPFSVEEVTLAELGPTDVLVRLAGVGFCHTDAVARGMASYVLPAILGHEGAGTVEAIGAEVDRVQVGDPVVLSFASCGACAQCLAGTPSYCVLFTALNMSARNMDGTTSATDADGAEVANRWFGQSSFAAHSIVDQRNVVVVDADVDLAAAAPLGCGIQTGAGTVLRAMGVQPGQSIVVFGAGAVGLAAVLAAKLAGAGDIVAVDLHESRLDLALELGATRVVRGDDRRLVDKIVGDGTGLDFALDTTGVGAVMEAAIESVGPGGQVVLVAASEAGLAVHPTQLTGKTISYVLEGAADPQEFIPYLIGQWRAGDFPFDRLITTYPFAEIDRAEQDAHAGTAIKPVLVLP
ncbi:alcohol dehydrogenase [Agromyces rhizosphaerae]|uniref:Alcohol dehydrogenase n=1 Tax=Agromyces rhizosphaerae TaxID=88374 RepID=A0A9W6CU96_9MICO|nr:NAD(P)-dependent alcohol dehydrogenase [Agromyces rhizosphaerae]GLI28588.1 alcohol dehydrogenase [Agromyces rhizosphaerae]